MMKTMLPGRSSLFGLTLAMLVAGTSSADPMHPIHPMHPMHTGDPVHPGDPMGVSGPFASTSILLHDGGWSAGRADGHAPIGVMGDHQHAQGEWMVSYRYMTMSMDGNFDGTDRVSSNDIRNDPTDPFPVVPNEMDMEMHMFGFMYAPSDRVTVMLMVPFLKKDMDHTAMGGAVKFTTETEGLGDISLSGLVKLWEGDRQSVHWNAGLSLPTGSIDEEDGTPASGGADVQLPYPMQLGSGTFDLEPGITWLGQGDRWSWGAQGIQTLRIGENDNDYRLGNRTDLTGWVARRLGSSTSVSMRLAASRWGDIHGADPDLNPAMVPTADPKRRGGKRVDLFVGLNLHGSKGALKGHRLAFEVGAPLHQDLEGPQLGTELIATVGWQFSP